MWESGKYTITTKEAGNEVVDGIIHTSYSLGIHVDYNNRMAVTHLATGCRLLGSFSPKHFGDAMNFVEAVGPLADWADPEPTIDDKRSFDNIAQTHLPPEAFLNLNNAK